jgi:organic radical activating enzyme
MSKQLIVDTDIGPIEASIEDLVSSKLNSFEGWKCDAGVQNLYIDFDGRVWISNCAGAPFNVTNLGARKPWGYLGKYNIEFPLPTSNVDCPKKYCGCGSDIVINKQRPGHTNLTNSVKVIPITEVKTVNSVRTSYDLPKQILWDIGRRCNYDCSYCWPSVHNTTDPHKNFDDLKFTADYCIDRWADGKKINWYFGGGEPTLNPDFEPFVDYLSSRGQWIMLVTNGSQGPSYWTKNADNYDTLIFSAHFEFMKPELFAKNFSKVVEVISNKPKKLSTFVVKLMTKPGEVEHSKSFVDKLKMESNYSMLPQNIKDKIMFDMVPLRDIQQGNQLIDYTDHDLEQVISFNLKK